MIYTSLKRKTCSGIVKLVYSFIFNDKELLKIHKIQDGGHLFSLGVHIFYYTLWFKPFFVDWSSILEDLLTEI